MVASAIQIVASPTASCSKTVQRSFRRTAFSHSQGLKAGVARISTSQGKSLRSRIVCEAKETAEAGVTGVVTDTSFKELVLDNPGTVLVDFWAPWCGPCRMIAPVIDDIAKDYGSKLTCLKLNTDESPGVPTEYGIRSIPTVMIFKGGKKLDAVIGAVPKGTLVEAIEKYL